MDEKGQIPMETESSSGRTYGWATRRRLVVASGALMVFVAGGLVHSTQLVPLQGHATTMMKHVRFAERIQNNELYFPNQLLYRLVNWFYDAGLSRELALIAILGVCTAIVWLFTYRFAEKELAAAYSPSQLAAIAGLTLVVNALYLPIFGKGVYLGQWGPNIYNNPTHTLVLAFSVPLFIAIGVLISQSRGNPRQFWTAAALSLALAVSVYAKPTFMIIAAPATVIYAGIRMGLTLRTGLVLVALLAVPTFYLLYLRYQAVSVDLSRFHGRTNAIVPFFVWERWSRSVAVSMALVFAFPVIFAASAWREHRFGGHFEYAWLICATATTLAILLVEVGSTGRYLVSGNWFGGYILANHLLFMVAIVEFFQWRQEIGEVGRRRLRYRLCTALLTYHALSGAVYLYRLTYLRGVAA